MAAGDAYIVSPVSTADTAHLDLQPSAGVEVVVHNCYLPEGKKVEIYVYDGTDTILVMTTYTSLFNVQFHCTNSVYVRMKNVSGGAIILSADGMTTK